MSLSKFFLTFCRSSSAVVAAIRAFDTAERVSRLLYIGMESDRPIDLRITENPDTVTFHIIDYGKGIDEQTIPLILKGEYTAPRTSDTHRGMGIGLSICNTIVQAHGGKIAAHNHADGAEFLFTLPKGDT